MSHVLHVYPEQASNTCWHSFLVMLHKPSRGQDYATPSSATANLPVAAAAAAPLAASAAAFVPQLHTNKLAYRPSGWLHATPTEFACLLCGGFMAAIAIIKAYLQAHNPRQRQQQRQLTCPATSASKQCKRHKFAFICVRVCGQSTAHIGNYLCIGRTTKWMPEKSKGRGRVMEVQSELGTQRGGFYQGWLREGAEIFLRRGSVSNVLISCFIQSKSAEWRRHR